MELFVYELNETIENTFFAFQNTYFNRPKTRIEWK